MAHILVGGDPRVRDAVRALLRQWGMTSGPWPEEGLPAVWPSVHDCDGVVLALPVPWDPAAGPRPSQQTTPAPLLLLGDHPGPLLLARDAQRVLADPGPGGLDLQLALRACIQQSGADRSAGKDRPDSGEGEDYRHFLGHELRSPLTAAKTALEVLEGELGGLAHSGEGMTGADRSGLQMVEIALRNLRRLQRTVDWSQDLLELETGLIRGRWMRIPLGDLPGLVDEVPLEVQPRAAALELEANPGLLRLLVGQVVRVFRYALPHGSLAGQVQVPADGRQRVELVLGPVDVPDRQTGPRISRTGLAGTAAPDPCTPGEELQRLVTYVVSRSLLEQLGAALTIEADDVGRPLIVLHLAAAVSRGERAELPAALHVPA